MTKNTTHQRLSRAWVYGALCAALGIFTGSQVSAQDAAPAPDPDAPPPVLVTLPMVNAPINQEPVGFMDSGGFEGVLMNDQNTVKDLDSGKVLFAPKDPNEGYEPRFSQCHVGSAPYIGCGLVSSKINTKTVKVTSQVGGRTVKVDKVLTWEHHRIGYVDSDGKYVEMVARQDSVPSANDPSVGTRHRLEVLGHFVTPQNTPHLFFRVTKTTTRRKGDGYESETVSQTVYWDGQKAQPFAFGAGQDDIDAVQRNSGSGAGHPTRTNPMLQFAMLGDKLCMAYATDVRLGPIVLECVGDKPVSEELFQKDPKQAAAQTGATVVQIAEEAMYDFRFKQGPDGWLYLFYHDPTEESAMVSTSRDGKTWTPQTLDSKESGWQLDAAVGKDQVYLLYYYFRNSFNKGLRIAAFKGGKVSQSPQTVVRDAEINTGWYPFLGVSSSDRLWMTYWDNVLEEHRTWSQLKSTQDLSQHVVKNTGGWEDNYKYWYLQAGVGGWFTAWQLFDFVPSTADTDDIEIGDTTYQLNNAFLTTVSFEGEFFGYSLGLSYARSILKDAEGALKEQFGDEAVDFFSGQLKIDKVFPGHDIKVQFTTGRYQGLAEPGQNVNFDRPGGGGFSDDNFLTLDTQYVDAQALFLNKWRIKYGLALTTYEIPMALHTWHAAEGEEQYAFTGTFLRQTSNTNIKALVGYSTLDYVSKYENRYNGFIFDAYIDGGISLLSFDPIELPGVDQAEDSTFTLDLRASVNIGWLYFKRWYNTLGFGFYVQPAYMIEGTFTGLPTRPGDRDLSEENADDSPDTSISPGIGTLRHGPRLDLGLVW